MDGFSVGLNLASVCGQGVLHLAFVGRLAGRPQPVWCYLFYPALLCSLALWLNLWPAVGEPLLVWLLELLLLYAFCRRQLPGAAALAAALLALSVPQLAAGLVASVQAMLLPWYMTVEWQRLLLGGAVGLALLLTVLGYWLIYRFFPQPLAESGQLWLLLLPGLFLLAAEYYILQSAYSVVDTQAVGQLPRHLALLLLQALGLAALFGTLWAYQRVCRGLQAQAAMTALRQAARAQQVYVAEAEARYAQTRAFRHDIKNHLAVLAGLLREGQAAQAAVYLQEVQEAGSALTLPCHTGNAPLDVLLEDKLAVAAARGVPVELAAGFGLPDGVVSDFDWCVIFANALDNALTACCEHSECAEPFVRISCGRQGDFYLLEFVNSCDAGPLPPPGLGLTNVRTAAEKYHGTVSISKQNGEFKLALLLNISLPPDDIS